MEEPQQKRPADEKATVVVSGEEETLVSPRFDDEETLVARPVVPLEEADAEMPAAGAVAPTPRAARPRLPFAPRRSGVLALVLVSVLVGGVLGGAGLYIYQRQSNDDAAATRRQPAAEAQPQQPAPAPTAEASNAPPPEAQAQPAAPAAGEPAGEQTSAPGASAGAPEAPASHEPEQVPAAGRRDAGAGTPKRGKKGERDEELRRPAPRADAERPASRADVAAEQEARRVDTIVYRPRRAARRERARRETAGDTDRLRRIFEGMPE